VTGTMTNIFRIIIHIAILYCIYLIGNWIQTTLGLVVPGSVIGMIILFILLSTNIIKVGWVEDGARFIVDNLALFFIPATVGIMNYFELFSGKGFLLVLIVLFSTFLVMGTSGLTSQLVMYRKEREHD
jgi:holin-like protein